MTVTQLFLIEQTVFIPIAICLLRFKAIRPVYIPLFCYLCVRQITESISYIQIHFYHQSNAVISNVSYLLEALLITWQLYNFNAFKRNKWFYWLLQGLWILVWLLDCFVWGSVHQFNFIYRVSYNFTLVFITAMFIGRLAITVRKSLINDTAFLISIAFCFWFVYNILFELFYKIAADTNNKEMLNFAVRILISMGFAEAIMFIIFAWALWRLPVSRVSLYK